MQKLSSVSTLTRLTFFFPGTGYRNLEKISFEQEASRGDNRRREQVRASVFVFLAFPGLFAVLSLCSSTFHCLYS